MRFSYCTFTLLHVDFKYLIFNYVCEIVVNWFLTLRNIISNFVMSLITVVWLHHQSDGTGHKGLRDTWSTAGWHAHLDHLGALSHPCSVLRSQLAQHIPSLFGLYRTSNQSGHLDHLQQQPCGGIWKPISGSQLIHSSPSSPTALSETWKSMVLQPPTTATSATPAGGFVVCL